MPPLNYGPKITRALSAQDYQLGLVAFLDGLATSDSQSRRQSGPGITRRMN